MMKKSLMFLIPSLLFLSGCGFIQHPRLTDDYWEDVVEKTSPQLNLVVWPIHGVVLFVCAIIDQTIYSFEIFYPALRDAYQYLILRGNGNNIMFEHTIAVPKTVATPLVFVGSYLARWFVPIGHDEQPFKME